MSSSSIAVNPKPISPLSQILAWVLVFGLGLGAWQLSKQANTWQLPFGISGKVLEYPLWAVLVGLAGNLALSWLGLKAHVVPALRTELVLKVGLVLLGSGINLALLISAASAAIIQGVIMITSVFFFGWWLGGIARLDDKLRAVMSTALAVCGVSAAIAAAGAVLAKKEQVTYVTGLVILVALPMMVLAPLAAGVLGLAEPVAGAWFGGNIDTTAAVVGAGTIYGEQAQKVASIVKSTQNALIGVVAFILAFYFSSREETGHKKRPNPRVIWERFPKFVLGFILASLLFTFQVINGDKGSTLDALKNWAFTFAYVSMGLELSFSEFRQMGWKPLAVFLTVTLFNTLLALGIAIFLFSDFSF